MMLTNKIDFAVVFSVKRANPNGDPLNGNRPRTTYDGIGEISDVCIKRKIRNRLLDDGQAIFVQSDDYKIDDCKSLKERADAILKDKTITNKVEAACRKWLDVRTFGQVFAYSADKKGEGLSIPVRGPVSIHAAFSLESVDVASNQITKSVSGEGDGNKKASDTMGMKHRVETGVYTFYGSMNPQLARKTGFSNEDALLIKKVLPILFENDESSARPAGSMEVLKVIWWEHNCPHGQYSSAKVHRSLKVSKDGNIDFDKLDGLSPEVIDGF